MSIISGLIGDYMHTIEKLRKEIQADVFSYTELMFALQDYKKPRDAVSLLLSSGRIIRIKKGLYIFGTAWRKGEISPEYLSNIIYGPSALSMDYALSYYGLIPEHSHSFTSVCTGRSKHFHTPEGNFFYYTTSEKCFSVQLNLHQTAGSRFLICSPLKALADKVWLDKRFNPVSLKSYDDYFFSDLRIDKDLLNNLADELVMNEIANAYQTRKIDRMAEFLNKWKGA